MGIAHAMKKMNYRGIHQFVAGFTAGDAISNEALTLRALFRRWGYAAEIFCELNHTGPALPPGGPRCHPGH